MATWMSHFRVADYFLDRIGGLCSREFLVGNIGPDCGEPNEDWSAFTPSVDITHWYYGNGQVRNHKMIDYDRFYDRYLKDGNFPTERHRSFYLGYFLHLLTDMEFSYTVARPKCELFKDELANDGNFIWVMKQDWYDLDHLFLKQHPEFRAFEVFCSINGFRNEYLDYYSESAIEKQIAYIQRFYKDYRGNPQRAYAYLTKQEMDDFLEGAVRRIEAALPRYI